MENPKIFNRWKYEIENCEPNSLLDCFREVEISVSSVCNLKCPFCPHSKGYSRKPEFMSVDTAKEIARQLKSFNYQGFICFGGHGEPSLNPNLEEIVNILKDFKPQLITNGINLDKEVWERLDKIAQIKVSVHDWNNVSFFKDKFKNTNAWFRNHDAKNPELNLFNRGGYLGKPPVKIERICHLPWYWIFIDCDGKYLECANDWEHTTESERSIFNTNIKDFYLEVLEPIREKMDAEGKRQNIKCCQNCDIEGTLIGEKFVEFWRKQK